MQHQYKSNIVWTGNRGVGTSGYKNYDRTWDLAIEGKPTIHCSNDPLLGGDKSKLNPEDLLVSALASCHMLWYLHYAADNGIIVHRYQDLPVGFGETDKSGAGRFVSAVLRPTVTVEKGTNIELALALHHRIHEVCFIARSLNFPVTYEPSFVEA